VLGDQGRGGRVTDTAHFHHRQSAQVRRRVLAHRKQQDHAFLAQPPTREDQRFPRLAIHPLRVIDQAQQRAVRGGLGQQRQGGQPGQKAVDAGTFGQTERGPQRRRLRRGQRVQPAQAVPEHQMQRRERQFELGFDPGAPQYREVLRFRHGMLQKGGLAAAGLACEHQHRAVPATGSAEQFPNLAQLRRPSVQHGSNL
jgi:hypothetical protein